MTAKRKAANAPQLDAQLKAVSDILHRGNISIQEFEEYSGIDYPIFSFKYLAEHSYPKCRDVSFFHSFLKRLQKLSSLGWKTIALSDRHSFGTELINVSQIKPKGQLPSFVSSDTKLEVFRASGNNLPFVGIRKGRTFHIIFIETAFGEVYDHD